MPRLRAVVGAVPRASVRRQLRRFVVCARDCRATQHEVLHRLIALNAESRFSREHRLDEVRNVPDFRRRLDVCDFEYFRPWIERLKTGDRSALLGPRNELLMFSLSSGTTSQAKYIPITRPFLTDYRRGWQIWGIQTLDDHPAINSRSIVQLSSDYDRYRTEGGTPCGNISGLVAAMQKRIVKTMYTVPDLVSKIPDPEAKNYTALRLAIADPHAALITTANPSTLIHLAKMAERESERLIRDIADGTLSDAFDVPEEIRRRLGRRLTRRNRHRAAELERLRQATGRFLPRDYWSEMEVVAVWTGGSAGAYLRALRRSYGDVPVRDHGLSASEGRMTIPLADNCRDGVLDVESHFFEFIPESEYERSDPIVLEAHELEEDRNYYILLTTSSGLYRYDICDVVRCTGFYGTTPTLEFLHKGAHIASVTGEKLSESQVVDAVCNSVERLQLQLRHFTVSPAFGEPPHYELLVEERDLLSHRVSERLAGAVDKQLMELNCEYREKRQSGRLAALSCLPLPDGTWSRFAADRQRALGGSLEQYKHPCLVPDLDFSRRLLHIYGEQPPAGRPTPADGAARRRAERQPIPAAETAKPGAPLR
ncbi:MAG: GH3 auxin-responsive promoter family protein [Planctomycetes bacterium]|nr:GH3 auxin-responsive promoter family protein [Planctomycetota bacterium]